MVSPAKVRALVLALHVSWAIGANSGKISTAEVEFQKQLDLLCQVYSFPGATAAFILPDGQYRGFATGYADRELAIAMRPDSLQLAGSVGKTFTSAVMLSLAQDGTLSLEDKVAKWLGHERWIWRLPNHSNITIRMLLNHSTGIPDHVQDKRFIGAIRNRIRRDPDFRFKPAELVQFVLDKDALFAPGRGYTYSDTNYILAGLIIERASRSSYYGELVRRFLTPLQLSLTGPADRRGLPSLAPGYVGGSNEFGIPRKTVVRGMLVVNPLNEWTGGGLVSNPQDLVRWAKALYEGKALKKPYLEDLLGSKAPRRKGEPGYGLGVDIERTELGPSYGHDGWFPGYRTKMAYFADHKIAVAIQVNTDEEVDTSRCALSLARALTAKPSLGKNGRSGKKTDVLKSGPGETS